MRVDWNDRLLCYTIEEQSGRYEADEDTWGTYAALLEVKIELEEKIRNAPQADPLDHVDDDLRALRDMLPDDEILLLNKKRHQADVPAGVDPGTLLAGVPEFRPEVVASAPISRPPECSKNPAGKHVASSYMRHSNGSLLGKCKCGHIIQNPDCPHMTQTLRGNKVVCAECGRPQIVNVGHWDNEIEQAAFIDPNRFKPS
jgi:hypothetical protein